MPTTEQWKQLKGRFGPPEVFLLREEGSGKAEGTAHGPRTCTVVALITDPSSRLLAVRKQGRRDWFLPKGGARPEQSVEEAAIKESLEEAGVGVEITGAPRAYVVDYVDGDHRLVRWHVVVTATTRDREPEPRDRKEIAEARFFDRTPDNGDELEGRWLKSILELWSRP